MHGKARIDDDIISVGAPLPRIEKATALDERKVLITWRTGETQIVDTMPALASKRIFIALRTDDALFQTLKVNEDGNAIEWDDGAELSAMWLERLAPANFNNEEFRDAMDTLGMSLDGMAATLEISRRQIADFRKDKPIPRHIALATRYLVEHHKKSA
ncbi:DUF2442 domain-containing protein [Phyllobacterium sp. 628]|uniref:DUF2442 domain-containing protein n=1 Tax=Phyllobacterium sp. 628 TaxID=2718938 RepID=UPI00166287DB|nr:DUF2442 domain-containing protein [Phyllobacterium sp. 628]QND51376.1 DUF2442 domain-containing protein [Phyllobacterium sp. 628]